MYYWPFNMISLFNLFGVLLLLTPSDVLASVNYPPIPKDKTTPVQQRLAIKGPNSFSVGWNTYEKLENACVNYGTSATSLDSQVCSSDSVTYDTSRTYFHAVTLTDLKPATKYFCMTFRAKKSGRS